MIQELEELIEANMVAITFKYQKKNKRNKTVHMFRTGDSIMCPVIERATIVRILKKRIPNANGETTEYSYIEGGITKQIDSNYTRIKIKSTVEMIGEENLGFTKGDAGLHSIRSGEAMSMFSSGVSEIIIQKVGRWESFAFLEYIREQVETFTYGVSTKMFKKSEKLLQGDAVNQ